MHAATLPIVLAMLGSGRVEGAAGSNSGGGPFSSLTLVLEVAERDVLPYEPLGVKITLRNDTNRRAIGHSLITPNHSYLEVWRKDADGRWVLFPSCDWGHIDTEVRAREFSPGASISQQGVFHLGGEGRRSTWKYLFSEPGQYELKLVLKDLQGDMRVESESVAVVVREPRGIDKEAAEFLRKTTCPVLLNTTPTGSPEVRTAQEEFLAKFGASSYAPYVQALLGRFYLMGEGKDAALGQRLLDEAAKARKAIAAEKALGVLVEQAVKDGDVQRATTSLRELRERFPEGRFRARAELLVGQATATRPSKPKTDS
jgi:hypothetical protein